MNYIEAINNIKGIAEGTLLPIPEEVIYPEFSSRDEVVAFLGNRLTARLNRELSDDIQAFIDRHGNLFPTTDQCAFMTYRKIKSQADSICSNIASLGEGTGDLLADMSTPADPATISEHKAAMESRLAILNERMEILRPLASQYADFARVIL